MKENLEQVHNHGEKWRFRWYRDGTLGQRGLITYLPMQILSFSEQFDINFYP